MVLNQEEHVPGAGQRATFSWQRISADIGVLVAVLFLPASLHFSAVLWNRYSLQLKTFVALLLIPEVLIYVIASQLAHSLLWNCLDKDLKPLLRYRSSDVPKTRVCESYSELIFWFRHGR